MILMSVDKIQDIALYSRLFLSKRRIVLRVSPSIPISLVIRTLRHVYTSQDAYRIVCFPILDVTIKLC